MRLISGRGSFQPVDPVRFDAANASDGTKSPDPVEPSKSVESRIVDRIVSLLERLHAEARNGAAWYSLHANRWARIYLTLGLPAAVLAAVAGVTALASTTSRVAAGIIALASAGVSAAAAFLDSRNNQKSCEALAASWSGFGSDVQQILTFDAARLAEVAERVVRLDTENAIKSEELDRRMSRGRRVLRNHEEELQRKINDLLMRQKDLLAGKIAASEGNASSATASTGPDDDDDW